MKKIASSIVVVAFLTGIAVTAQGEYVQRNTTPNVWNNWTVNGWYSESSVARLPTAADWVRIHYNRNTFITDARAAAKLDMYWLGGAGLRIDNGGSLNVTSANGYDGRITLSGAGDFSGIPNVGSINIQTGGTLTSSGAGDRTVLSGNASQRGTITLDGGTFQSGETAGTYVWFENVIFNLNAGVFSQSGTQVFYQNIEMNINGDQTDISFRALNCASHFAASVFNFNMDSDGVSTVKSTSSASLASADIFVDLANYTGGNGEFVLFSTISIAPETAAVAKNVGDKEVSFSLKGGNYVMTVIPEPATIGMMGIGALITLLIRRHLIS